jgi:hypothetical protein
VNRRFLTFISLSLLVLLILAAGCYEPGGLVPEEPYPPVEREWTPEEVEAAVVMEEVSIHSPAPRDNGIPPEECDYIRFLRFRPRNGSSDIAGADAVLVLTPGFYCGANAFEYMGRQLVYMALQQEARMEVWAVERRPNRLEDHTGLNAAEAAADTSPAVDYYYLGAELDGRTYDGHLQDEDVPYLSEFGLKLAIEDVYTVITTMVPDAEMRRQKVFVGGHSLGGPLTAVFASWDFDGDPTTTDDAGFRNCAGLVGLDGAISLTMGMFETAAEALPEEPPPDTSDDGMAAYYEELVGGLRDGSMPRLFPVSILESEALIVLELLGMEANWAPEEESTLLEEVPELESIDVMLKLLHSRSLDHYLIHTPDITDFRYTNEAQLGVILDDNSMPVKIVQASMGFLRDGPVVQKDFPLPGDLAGIPLLSDLLGSFISLEGLFIANDAGPSYFQLGQGPLYGWADFDQIGRGADPDFEDIEGSTVLTTMVEEVSDIQDVAAVLYKGPSNFLEWYFTMRLMVDFMAAIFPFAPEYGLNLMHMDRIDELPQVEFMAGSNMDPSLSGPTGAERYVLEGYNHIDVLTAAADRTSHRENGVLAPLIDFLLENSD